MAVDWSRGVLTHFSRRSLSLPKSNYNTISLRSRILQYLRIKGKHTDRHLVKVLSNAFPFIFRIPLRRNGENFTRKLNKVLIYCITFFSLFSLSLEKDHNDIWLGRLMTSYWHNGRSFFFFISRRTYDFKSIWGVWIFKNLKFRLCIKGVNSKFIQAISSRRCCPGT